MDPLSVVTPGNRQCPGTPALSPGPQAVGSGLLSRDA